MHICHMATFPDDSFVQDNTRKIKSSWNPSSYFTTELLFWKRNQVSISIPRESHDVFFRPCLQLFFIHEIKTTTLVKIYELFLNHKSKPRLLTDSMSFGKTEIQ